MKSPLQSKTIWIGTLTTILSILAILVDAWSLLSYEQLELLDEYFGPQTVAILGVVMVLLRAITSSPLTALRRQDPRTASGKPEEPLE